MKQIAFFIAVSLFVGSVSAKSTQLVLNQNFELVFEQAQSRSLSKSSSYRYSVTSRVESVGLVQYYQLSAHTFVGLGLWLGGLEIELETMPSFFRFEDYEVDLNRWLSARAKIDFADLIPFGNLAYRYQSRDEQLQITANAGLKLLLPSRISIDFEGELSGVVDRQAGLVSRLEQDTLNQLEDYYLEPVLTVGLNYTFD
jgi:hypothetical protein